ncbi:hypothetical protein E5N71_14485 [Candidatus Nitrosocosmicus sp. SS]|nr:hypothetical protein F1Z66_08375 [Candidatus Nitrosocosmicus sp. SS]KAF0867600.1 hypothetical protein E5N71_14485 [Candidatus Nitrosocosmicus sp. SS]
MVCKGICIRHKASKSRKSNSHYLLNHKRCQICQIFLEWKAGFKCPCCGSKLRTKPRNKKFKNMYREDMDKKGTTTNSLL